MTADQFRTAEYIIKRQKDLMEVRRDVEKLRNEIRRSVPENNSYLMNACNAIENKLRKENDRLLDEFKSV
jgi:hypothetical protein